MAPSSIDDSERHLFRRAGDEAVVLLPADSRESAHSRVTLAQSRGGVATQKQIGVVSLAVQAGQRTRRAAALELARGTAFNIAPAFLILGVLAYISVGQEPPGWLLVAVFVGFLSVAIAVRKIPFLRLLVGACLLVSMGFLLAKVEMLRASTPMLGGEITTRLSGRIQSIEHLANGRVRMVLDVVATDRPKLRYAPTRVRLSARALPDSTQVGDELQGVARLLPPLGPVRPGGYDFSFGSYFDGIGAIGFFVTPPTINPADRETGIRTSVENLRNHIADRIRTQIGGAEGEIAAALIAGVRAGIPEDVNEALRRTGLAHILSISGLHMALVAAIIMGAMRLGFALFPRFATRHPVRKYAAATALVTVTAYLFISGYQVAAQRSFLMIAIMLTALLFDHSALTMRNLALSAMAIIVLSPHEVAGPSFQMSFAATAALVGAYAAWSLQRRERPPAPPRHLAVRIGSKFALYVFGIAATSILAGAATTIYGAYHFQRVSPLSLAANLVVTPIVSVLVMPSAVLGVVAMPFGLDGLPLAVMGYGLHMMVEVAHWFSARSPIDAIGLIPSRSVVLLTIALILATVLTTWLRALALPFVVAGALTLVDPVAPVAFIAEDARLVGIALPGGRFAVNRTRPNAFTLQNWMRAATAETLVKPAKPSDAKNGEGFRCSAGVCVAEPAAGGLIVTAPQFEPARQYCGRAIIIVVEDATSRDRCAEKSTTILTGRDLALKGAAVLQAGRNRSDGDQPPLSQILENSPLPGSKDKRAAAESRSYALSFSIPQPLRPWHYQRKFSRSARGLPPWKPTRAISKEGTASNSLAPTEPNDEIGSN